MSGKPVTRRNLEKPTILWPCIEHGRKSRILRVNRDILFININVIFLFSSQATREWESRINNIWVAPKLTILTRYTGRRLDQSYGVFGSLITVNQSVIWQENSTRQRKSKLNLGISWLHKQQQHADFREKSLSKESVRPLITAKQPPLPFVKIGPVKYE